MDFPENHQELLLPSTAISLAELSAMTLDGVLQRVYGTAFRSVAVEETPQLRASAMFTQVPASAVSRTALARLSAAWVYGASPPPRNISLAVDSSHRCGALPSGSGAVIHEVKLGPYDVELLGGAHITSILRTAVDVACWEAPEDAVPVLLAFHHASTLRCALENVEHALRASPHFKGRRKGLATLKAINSKGSEVEALVPSLGT